MTLARPASALPGVNTFTPVQLLRVARLFAADPDLPDLLPAGEGRAFGAHHLHDVVNHEDVTALSVHAYSPRLDQMTHYDFVDGRLIPSGVEQRGESW